MSQLANMVIACDASFPPGTEVDLHYQSACKATVADVGADKVTLPSEPTFDPPGWFKTRILINTGGVQFGIIGEVGGQAMQSSFVFFIIGDEAEQVSFAACLTANSGNLIMGLKRRTGTNRVIGTDKIPAYIEELTGNSQIKVGEGRVGTAYKVTYDGPPLFFDGDFTLSA